MSCIATIALIGVGSNLGDRQRTLAEAQKILANQLDITFLRTAPTYETEPVGGPPGQSPYLNTVWEIETELTAQDLLSRLFKIETQLGRERRKRNEPRTLDLDVLFYGDHVMNSSTLTVPHPRLHERWFVLKPLWDLRADLVHPVFGKSVCELLDNISGSSKKSGAS